MTVQLEQIETDWTEDEKSAIVRQLLAVADYCEQPETEDETEDENYTDVRLRWHNGEFYLNWGDSSYDQDHRGCWGCSSVSYGLTEEQAAEIADDMFEQAAEQAAQTIGEF